MQYDEIIDLIEQCDPHKDWVTVYPNKSDRKFCYRADVRLRIEPYKSSDGNTPFRYQAKWLELLAEDDAYEVFYRIYFNSTLIKEIFLIAVGGGAAEIPKPVSNETLEVKNQLDLSVAMIVNDGSFNQYYSQVFFN